MKTENGTTVKGLATVARHLARKSNSKESLGKATRLSLLL